MDELALSLLVIAVVGIFVAGLFTYLSWRKRRQTAAFETAAAARGWRVRRLEEPLRSGLVLEGGQPGATWTLEVMTTASTASAGPGSSEVSHVTHWWSKDIALPTGAVVLGPPLPGNLSDAHILDSPLARMALNAMLGHDAGWASRLKPVALPRARHLLCLADAPEDARRLLGGEDDPCIASLPTRSRAVITLRDTGLDMRLPGERLDDPDDIARFIALGECLMDNWKKS